MKGQDMTLTYLITGGTTPDGLHTDVAIDADGTIAHLGQNLTVEAEHTIDATGKIVLPGLVDLHTHLREPGNDDAETVETGTRAAAKGGFTAVHAMANPTPMADTADLAMILNARIPIVVIESPDGKVRPTGSLDKRPVINARAVSTQR